MYKTIRKIQDDIINMRSLDEIKNYMDQSNTTKWNLLIAMQNLQHRLVSAPYLSRLFEEVINSDLFSAEELYQKFVTSDEEYEKWFSTPKISIILEKIKSYIHWQDITDVDELINYINKLLTKEKGFLECVKYFETHNENVYRELIKQRPAMFYIKNHSDDELFASSKILLTYINSKLDEETKNISHSSQDLDYGYGSIFKERYKTFLKLCMISPESSMLTLKKLITTKLVTLKDVKEVCTPEQIKELPTDVKLTLKNYENVWRIHSKPELVFYNAPEGKEWYVFEYFAVNNPVMMRRLANLKLRDCPYSRKAIVERYSRYKKETLPPALRDYIEESINLQNIQKENGKRTAEMLKAESEQRKKQWLNAKGELIQFFALKDGIPFTTKQEYYDVADFFKSTGLSASAFCHKYQIEDIDGFRLMLNKVAEDIPEFAKFYEEFSANQRKDFVITCRDSIIGIVNDETPISTIIQNSSSSQNLSKMIEISESLFDDPSIVEQFVQKIIAYYHSRLNSYNLASNNLDDVNNMLSFKEILYFIEPETLKKLNSNVNVDLYREFSKAIEKVKDKLPEESRKLLYSSRDSIRVKIKPYASTFDRYLLLNSNTQLALDDGSLVDISNDIIDMANCYATSHGLFKATSAMNKIIMAIADGRIQNQEETALYKQQLKEQIAERMQNCERLEMVVANARQKSSQ